MKVKLEHELHLYNLHERRTGYRTVMPNADLCRSQKLLTDRFQVEAGLVEVCVRVSI